MTSTNGIQNDIQVVTGTETRQPRRQRRRAASRVLIASALAALTGLAVALPSAVADEPAQPDGPVSRSADAPRHNALRRQVEAILETGPTGVTARTTGPGGHRRASTGVADRESGAPVRGDERFRIASTTKSFVATVMLQLVAEGEVSLDDTVEEWLPGVVSGNGNDGSEITVRRLLNHTSGLFNYTGDFPLVASAEDFKKYRFTTWGDEQLVAIAMGHEPSFEPGAEWEYSNTNYILAGMIIEKATGRSWRHEVRQRILRPLHLRDTFAPHTYPHIPGRHLKGYSDFGEKDAKAIDVTDLNPSAAGAAGAMISTTDDVSRYFKALLKGRLLPDEQMKELKTTVRAEEMDKVWPGARYGLGLLEVPLSCGGVYYGHAGDLMGYTTRNGTTADGRATVVLHVTGDGADDLSTEHAQNALIDKQLCASRPKK